MEEHVTQNPLKITDHWKSEISNGLLLKESQYTCCQDENHAITKHSLCETIHAQQSICRAASLLSFTNRGKFIQPLFPL
jgi:hypothetical protein